MAPRGRSAILSDHVDRDYDSSPDPLALSLNNNTTGEKRSTSPRKPLRTTSPSKQNQSFTMPNVEFSSPAKSMIMSTPRVGGASPWRIKVTVQAEPGSDEENDGSPSVKRVTRTKTTTVPLKDPDAQSPVKRPRGRPRKSDVGTAAKPKRAGTPLKRVARSRSREASIGAAADVDTDAPPKRGRGRPRKSAQLPPEDYEMLGLQDLDMEDMVVVEPNSRSSVAPESTRSKKSTRFATPELSHSPMDNSSGLGAQRTFAH